MSFGFLHVTLFHFNSIMYFFSYSAAVSGNIHYLLCFRVVHLAPLCTFLVFFILFVFCFVLSVGLFGGFRFFMLFLLFFISAFVLRRFVFSYLLRFIGSFISVCAVCTHFFLFDWRVCFLLHLFALFDFIFVSRFLFFCFCLASSVWRFCIVTFLLYYVS